MSPAASPVDLALVRRLERASLLSVPAEQEWEVGGWLCRWGADGRVGRVASACVSPFAAAGQVAPAAVVASTYAARGLPALLRVTPLAPVEVLASATPLPGKARVAIMTRDLGVPGPEVGRIEVALAEDPSPDWSEAFRAAQPDEGAARLALAAAAPSPRRFAAALVDGTVAGLALGVVAEGALGAFDVLTALAFRRRGVATAVMSALMAWGRAQGADVAYLQVAEANAPAVALYEGLGFGRVYSYFYSAVEALSPAPA